MNIEKSGYNSDNLIILKTEESTTNRIVEQSEGEPTASSAMAINIVSQQSLITRTLDQDEIIEEAQGESLVPKKSYLIDEISADGSNKLEELKNKCLQCYLSHVIKFINQKIDPDYSLAINEMTNRQLYEKLGVSIAKIMTQNDEMIEIEYCDYLSKLDDDMDELFPSQEEDDIEFESNTANMSWDCSVYTTFLGKYHEYSEERNRVSELIFNPNNDKEIKKLNFTNDIEKLKHLMQKKYYNFFRKILDPNVPIYERTKKYLDYVGASDLPKKGSDLFIEMKISYFDHVIDNSCYAIRLQIFIDLLVKAQQSPKTLDNLMIVVLESKKCFDFFHEDVKKFQKVFGKNCEIGLLKDYYEIKNELRNLMENFQKLYTLEDQRQTKEAKKRQFSKKPAAKKPLTKPVKYLKEDSAPESKVIPEGTQEISAMTSVSKEEKSINEPQTLPEPFNIQNLNAENDLADIEREVSDCFEAIRQMIDNDRKRKLELKEAKPKKKEASPLVVPSNPLHVKLSTHNKSTLEILLSQRNLDREISHQNIECLVIALNGFVVQGKKNKQTIFWGDKNGINLKTKSYEFIHGQDGRHLLKSGHAKQVKKAIIIGIKAGYISRDILKNLNLDQDALNAIELDLNQGS